MRLEFSKPGILLFALLYVMPAGAQTEEANITTALQQHFQALNDAIRKKDTAAYAAAFADEFLFVHATGYTQTKADMLASFSKMDSSFRIAPPSWSNILLYDKAAIVRDTRMQWGQQIVGTQLFVKRNGRWQIAQIQGTFLQAEKKIVDLASHQLAAYAGTYQRDNGRTLTVSVEDNLLVMRSGELVRQLFPTSSFEFYDQPGSTYTFYINEAANVQLLILRLAQGGQLVVYKRVP